MEWVETTARTVEEAKELALDQLGVVADEAEFEVLASPSRACSAGCAARRGCAARVRPAPVRPKQDRRRGRAARRRRRDATGHRARRPRRRTADAQRQRSAARSPAAANAAAPSRPSPSSTTAPTPPSRSTASTEGGTMTTDDRPFDEDPRRPRRAGRRGGRADGGAGVHRRPDAPRSGSRPRSTPPSTATRSRSASTAPSLGLLIGPGGRTLLAIQDLARVAAQRRLGDHETRLRVDVAGYREKRRVGPGALRRDGRRAGAHDGRRPVARPDAVGRPQGPARRARPRSTA